MRPGLGERDGRRRVISEQTRHPGDGQEAGGAGEVTMSGGDQPLGGVPERRHEVGRSDRPDRGGADSDRALQRPHRRLQPPKNLRQWLQHLPSPVGVAHADQRQRHKGRIVDRRRPDCDGRVGDERNEERRKLFPRAIVELGQERAQPPEAGMEPVIRTGPGDLRFRTGHCLPGRRPIAEGKLNKGQPGCGLGVTVNRVEAIGHREQVLEVRSGAAQVAVVIPPVRPADGERPDDRLGPLPPLGQPGQRLGDRLVMQVQRLHRAGEQILVAAGPRDGVRLGVGPEPARGGDDPGHDRFPTRNHQRQPGAGDGILR